VLGEGRTAKKRFLLLFLPACLLLEGLGGWPFWHVFTRPKTHYVVGWICGGLFGLFYGLGVGALGLFRKPAIRHDPESPHRAVLIVGGLLSLLSVGMDLTSFIKSQPKELVVEEKDRVEALTTPDLAPLLKNCTPDRRAGN
jgi:hypothetical protein